MNEISYTVGDALPDTPVTWKEDGVLQEFASGWDVSARVGLELGLAGAFEKTSGFVLADTDPNVIIQWTNSDLGTLAAGTYICHLRAVETGGGTRPMSLKFRIRVEKGVLTP